MNHRLDEWVPRVYRFALRLCEDAHTAEDLTQDTFLRAWQKKEKLRDARALRVWLFRITANLWRDRLRRGRLPVARAGLLPEDLAALANSPGCEMANRDDVTQALAAMSELPARQREVLYMIACESMTATEIADVLAISTDAVKTNLSLARKAMRDRLGRTV